MAQAVLVQAAVQQGADMADKGMQGWNESTRRQELVIRGPPPKESVSMVKYITIAVGIIVVLLIIFVLGKKPQEAPHYQSIFDKFTPNRLGLPVEPAKRDYLRPMESNSAMVFGIIPKQPVKL